MALTDNIVAYWKFDENTGTSAADATGSGYTGTLSGSATWGTAKLGTSSLSLNGTSAYVDAGTGPTTITAFSISAWVNPSNFSGYYQILNRANVAGDYRNFELDIEQTSGKPRVVFTTAASTYQTLVATSALTSGVWSHVVGTYDGTTMTVYINGASAGTLSVTATPSTGGTQKMLLGAINNNGSPNSPYFPGLIDEVGLWSRALTSTEVSQLYNSGNGLQYPFSGGNQTALATAGSLHIRGQTGVASVTGPGSAIATAGSLHIRGQTGVAVVTVPPIAPNSVTSATLKVWLKADAGCLNGSAASCVDGDTVATWQDQSGGGFNATGATGPVYKSSVFANGKPALLFSKASSQYLSNSYNGAAGTIIAVFYSDSPGTYAPVIVGKPQAGATITAYDIYAETQPIDSASYGTYSVRQFDWGTTTSSSAYSWYTNTQRVRNAWSISGMKQDGVTLKSYEQASLLASMAFPGGTVHTATGQVIGAGDFGGTIGSSSSYFNGYIAELITYDGPVSDTEYAGVVAWLQNKYGITPSGSYLLMAENEAAGAYSDLVTYLWQGDGTNWNLIPSNYVPVIQSGQTTAGSLAMQLLTDDEGNLIKYNGYYWAENSRAPYPNTTYPSVYIDILRSTDLVRWTVATTISTDTLGITDGTTTTRGCYNDGWFVDRGNGNAVYALLNASNNEQNLAGLSEWAIPVTLNSNGSVTVGTAIHFSGTQFPTGTTSNTGYFAEWISILGSTYYTFYTNMASGGSILWASSTSPFTGYNTGGSISAATGSPAEWPRWIQSGGNGTLYWNNSPTDTKQATASDGALGTVSGVTVGASLVFHKASTLNTFKPQGSSVAKLPALILPSASAILPPYLFETMAI